MNVLLPGLDYWLCLGDPSYAKVLRLAADLDAEAKALYQPTPADLDATFPLDEQECDTVPDA